uniref:Uncharacterized protein n=1 Tax=Nelumbo nucifera TaxID=4432 RepID=A0A822ZCT4_NELNU|nr:TPA_asm: hypothetical protein HUJ06_000594 [Nelumbo nucifera]
MLCKLKIQALTALKELRITAIPKLQEMPEELGNLPSLENLTLEYIPHFASLPQSFHAPKALTPL